MTGFFKRLTTRPARLLERLTTPPPGIELGRDLLPGGSYTADLCIVTNCAFPGGNAATTITELIAFRNAGLSVLIVHCPVKRSRWKWRWLAERYLPYQGSIVPADEVEQIRCDTVIVRAPRMIMTDAFGRLARRIRPGRALFVVNNSAWNEDGTRLFDWAALHARVEAINWPGSAIYPISPIIRSEALLALTAGDAHRLGSRDWPPAFDVEKFPFKPRDRLAPPIIIGRHGRDHPGKWLEDPDELRAAYPASPDYRVRVLGGAATVAKRLGKLPGNWEVEPFGVLGVEAYLASLDVFVFFPARTRDEAFGRTVVEALLSGLPAILPPKFEASFGDLGLYCEPAEVEGVITRLAADDAGRLGFLSASRREAARCFGTESLVRRLQEPAPAAELRPRLDPVSNRFRRQVMPA